MARHDVHEQRSIGRIVAILTMQLRITARVWLAVRNLGFKRQLGSAAASFGFGKRVDDILLSVAIDKYDRLVGAPPGKIAITGIPSEPSALIVRLISGE